MYSFGCIHERYVELPVLGLHVNLVRQAVMYLFGCNHERCEELPVFGVQVNSVRHAVMYPFGCNHECCVELPFLELYFFILLTSFHLKQHRHFCLPSEMFISRLFRMHLIDMAMFVVGLLYAISQPILKGRLSDP